jgi:hypothetical protein
MANNIDSSHTTRGQADDQIEQATVRRYSGDRGMETLEPDGAAHSHEQHVRIDPTVASKIADNVEDFMAIQSLLYLCGGNLD